MVLVGTSQQAYLSHLPMFRRPHDVQLIAEVTLHHADWKTPPDFSETLHTFVPAKFDLTALMEGRVKELSGDVHRGNFEAEGPLLKSGVKVKVKRLLKVQPLQEGQVSKPALFVFGTPERAFAANEIGAAPSFDQIIRVRVISADAASLAKGQRIEHDRTAPLKEGDRIGQVEVVKVLSLLAGPHFVP